ncbi:hypothetical protein Pfo_028513 [Paulownia fortunei]|nr:hypothetical protein Pfo_028513 [Paulownia fortunei]
MEMEDKESTESGSPGGNSEVDSPPSSGGAYGGEDSGAGGGGVFPEVINMALNISMEKNAGMTSSPAVAVGAGVIGGGRVMGGGIIGSGGGGGVMGGGAIGVGGGGGGSGEIMMGKKKRGRPRKYDSDGNLRAAYVRSPPGAAAQTPSQPGFTLSTPPSYEYTSGSKRGRGKPSGSGNWQALASLVILQDVAGKILTFAQKGTRGVCVLSANGSVSNVTIRQPGSSGGLLTYEAWSLILRFYFSKIFCFTLEYLKFMQGRFEILTLTGSYLISDNGGIKSRTGGLSVSLASPDGRVIGGGLAGLLMAASPIQIVVGSFVPNGFKMHKRKHQTVPRVSPSFQFGPATVTAAIPISQAAPESNIYPMPTSQLPVQSRGEADNCLSSKDHPNSASTDTADWNGSGPSSDQRPSPDINISIPVEEH